MRGIVVGIQRSGTNYLETLIRKNFRAKIASGTSGGGLWKHAIFCPDKKRVKIKFFIAIYKNPYKWIESLMRKNGDLSKRSRKFNGKGIHKRKSEEDIVLIDSRNRKTSLISAIQLYNDFYEYWLQFPCKSMTYVKYEDLLVEKKREEILKHLGKKFKWTRAEQEWVNPKKVAQSSNWEESRIADYLDQKNLRLLKKKHVDLINKYIKKDILEKMGYKIIEL